MKNNKIFILLPDGVGLRNFAFTDFYKLGKLQNFNVVFWNNTPFQLSNLGFKDIQIQNAKINPITDLLKNIKIQSELNVNIKKSNDNVYDTYRFPFRYNSFKNSVKNVIITTLVPFYSSEDKLQKLRSRMENLERKTNYYKESIATLKNEKPAIVFCTNQRPVLAIAPIVAAKDLGIPTATFIFSWDNLPKATMIIETDFYFVWSELMKKQLLYYYPNIKESQIKITGTPQFEPHFDATKIENKVDFFNKHNLDTNKKYICYSGDDVTTCPNDQLYLENLAEAVTKLNNNGHQLGIIFRRCPVDFSDRYDIVLSKYKELIVPIAPIWKKQGDGWNTILPTSEDITLQMNTIFHTEFVVNLGSSMVFDYASHNKPCVFINYNANNQNKKNWSVKRIYNYVHFRSMPYKNAVVWLNNKEEIATKIESVLNSDNKEVIENAQKWFETINQDPPQDASKRIWEALKSII